MLRRKLFAYTMMYTAGISAGFFIFERARIAGGALVMLIPCIIAAMAGTGSPGILCRIAEALPILRKTVYDQKPYGDALLDRRLKAGLITAVIMGFLIFTFRYIWYGTGILPLQNGSDDNNGQASVTDTIESVTGTVSSVTFADGKVKIILSNTDVVRRGMRVMMTMRTGDGAEEQPEYDPALLTGRRITAYGRLKEPYGADNPGCFDYRIYLRSRGIGCIFSAVSFESSDGRFRYQKPADLSDAYDQLAGMTGYMRGRYMRTLISARERFLDLFIDEEIRGFIKGAVFGDKSDISEEVMDEFTCNGTGHILAVSGLHTGFLYALLRFATRKRNGLPSALLTIIVLIMYGDMTMWSPSAMRAVTVLSTGVMAVCVRRPFDLLTSVSAAAVLILTAEPYQLFSAGFQMSFLALLGISFLAEPLSHFTGRAFAVMLSVQAGIMPVSAFVFHRINLMSVFINIPVIFLASVLVPLCMTSLLILTASGSLPGAVITVSEGLAELIMRINSYLTAGGYFSDLTAPAGAGFIIFIYLALFLTASEWTRVRLLRKEYMRICTAVICIVLVSAAAGSASCNRFADDEIVFVAVGQGDCTHIRAGGKDVLIDGGGSTERNTGKDILMPYLLANGAENTELALVTHLHTDHYLGIAELEQIYPVGAVGIPSDYRKSIEDMSRLYASQQKEEATTNKSIVFSEYRDSVTEPADKPELFPEKIVFIEPRSRIYITTDVFIEPIWPPAGAGAEISINDPNEHNMVYMVHYSTKAGIHSKEGLKIMVTGDLLEEDELKMVEYYRGTDTLKCDVLKVAHHGSKSSSSEAFLDAASPSIAVIQVGLNNWYGHPHAQTLERLEDRGIRVYRTDLNGAVGIDIGTGKPAATERIKIDLMRD